MQLSRRNFLKISAPIAGMFVLGSMSDSAALAKNSLTASPSLSEKAILYDSTMCVGCRACQNACRRWNELPPDSSGYGGIYDNPSDLSAKTWTLIKFKELGGSGSGDILFFKYQCMHCTEAACVEVCPSGALFHNEYGMVAYDKDKCIGCGYCTQYCPFQVPHLSDGTLKNLQKVGKCDFCVERVTSNQQPACVNACPTGALSFGDREELVVEGNSRVTSLRTSSSRAYPQATLYGETELGGLHVLNVLADRPSVYGLPEEPEFPATITIQKEIFRPLTWIVWGAAAAGLALNVLIARARQTQEKEE